MLGMAVCPKCNANIKDDFGLVECSECGAQILLQDDISQVLMDEVSTELGEGEAIAELDSMPVSADLLEQDIFDMSQPSEVSAPTPVAEFSISNSDEKLSSPDMGDIADFGNSASSQGREGLLRYNILISGIDTSELRSQIKEALADQRFLWDVEGLILTIQNGTLCMRDLTAVKSSLLLQKIRALDVKVQWEQYAIHQT